MGHPPPIVSNTLFMKEVRLEENMFYHLLLGFLFLNSILFSYILLTQVFKNPIVLKLEVVLDIGKSFSPNRALQPN